MERTSTCVVYVRVNPEADARAVEAQKKAVERHAVSLGLSVVGAFTDACSGATEPADRVGFRKALAALTSGTARALVARDPDRIARESLAFATTVDLLSALGVTVYVCGSTEPMALSSADQRVAAMEATFKAGGPRKPLLEDPTEHHEKGRFTSVRDTSETLRHRPARSGAGSNEGPTSPRWERLLRASLVEATPAWFQRPRASNVRRPFSEVSSVMRRSLLPLVSAATFGAADQFLGARAFVVGNWATDASLLSAPWLLIAFVAGWSQSTVRRAVILGFVCTIAALVGYAAMTLSPIEGAAVTLYGVRGLLSGQAAYAVGALLTGPFFGWLGYRWRTRHDWMSALVAALMVCCEPLAHAVVGTTVSFSGVWAAEVVVGLLIALYVIAGTRHRATG